ncbi:fimbrillin family protein [Hoylesella timonensis]|uniref:fimbrillin family protein n=1 Tax=Hoylesella timonensis TaxID=386414 RepID=UPI00336A9F19
MKIKSILTHMPFFLMGMMACLIMSCSQDMESNIEQRSTPSGEVSVNFVTNLHGTRGTMYDAINFIPDNDLFGVQGYTTDNGFENMGNDPNFIDNGQTTKSGKVAARNAAAWKNAKKYVQLVGTYPFLESDNSIVKTGKDTYKVTFTPEEDAHKQERLNAG